MIVALMLPERLASASEDAIGFMRGKPLQGSQPLGGNDAGRIAVEPALAVANGLNYEPREFRNAQMPSPGLRAIQYAVHRHEGLAISQAVRWEDAIGGQAVVEAESDEKGLADRVPVRKASLVVLHLCRCAASAVMSSERATAAIIGGPTRSQDVSSKIPATHRSGAAIRRIDVIPAPSAC